MAHSTITLELPIFVEISEISCRLERSVLATFPIEYKSRTGSTCHPMKKTTRGVPETSFFV